MTMTPAEHRAQAEADLARLAEINPAGSAAEVYRNLALSAVAHVLAAVAEYLEPPPDQGIPGLPPGWRLETQQSGSGDRFWCWILTRPGHQPSASRYSWKESGTALLAGLRTAGELAEQGDGTILHTGVASHDGYAAHSHEVRPDHQGVVREG